MPAYRDILPLHASIESLRERERRRYSARHVSDAMSFMTAAIRKDARALSELNDVLEAHLPAELRSRTAIEAVSRGTLTLACDSAASRYTLDAWLRAGGSRDITRATRASVSRIRTSIASPSTFDTRLPTHE